MFPDDTLCEIAFEPLANLSSRLNRVVEFVICLQVDNNIDVSSISIKILLGKN